jgi:hypothetical protein
MNIKLREIQMKKDQSSWNEFFGFLPGLQERLKLLREPFHPIFLRMNSQALKELFEKSESRARNNKLIIVFS